MTEEGIRSILRLFMGWGIRLKNNDMKKIVKSTFWSFIVQCMISLTIMGIIMIILAESRAIFDFQWLYNIFPHLYDLLDNIYELVFERAYFIFIIFGTTLIIVLSLLYKLLNKIFSYVFAVSESADKLFDKNVEYINLPPEMVEVEKKLNHFKTEAIKNERLARENEQKKDELIVYLAHDIKTPLTSMIGYLSLLSEIKDMPQEQRNRYIDIALDKSYRLEYLINELFDVARFNSEKIVLEKEEINLNLMLEQIADDFYPTLKEMNKKINFTSDEKTILYADPDKLSRVFNNLIKNAISYSKEESEIVINLKKDNNNAIVEVINKGKQISKEKLSKIFEKFYRLDSARTSRTGGSGLGLAIAKDIVELHNGTIIAESNEEETTFRVTLPLK